MANIYKINADAIRIPKFAGTPSSLEDGLIWYDTVAGTFKQRQNGSTQVLSGGETSDSIFRIVDNGDATKKLAFEVSAITTGTTRTITVPDSNVDLGSVVTAIQRDGSVAFTADQSLGGFKITNLATPSLDTDAATKAYVDAVQQGLDIKASVRVATTANITLSAPQTIDGVAAIAGNRVLVKNQTTGSENGIYVVAAGAWSRSLDADDASSVTAGLFTFVAEGTVNADSGWVLTTNDTIIVDTTVLTFTQFSGAGQITAGSGLSKSGNTLDVNVDGVTIEISADAVQLKAGGISNTHINASAAIDATKIHDGSVTNTEFGYLGAVTSDIQTQFGTKASTALSNLASVAINVSLISDSDAVDSLGSSTFHWNSIFGKSLKSTNGLLIDADNDRSGDAVTNLAVITNVLKIGKDANNYLEQEYIHATTLTASSTAVLTAFTFAHATYQAVKIDYSVKEATSARVRVGTLYVATNGTDTTITDTFTESADVGVTWAAAVNGANLEVSYTTTANAKTLRADIKRFVV